MKIFSDNSLREFNFWCGAEENAKELSGEQLDNLEFILKDLSIDVDADEFKTSLSDFSFTTDIYVPPVKKIPLGISAVKLVETLSVNINPAEKLNLSFSSKEAIFNLSIANFSNLPSNTASI